MRRYSAGYNFINPNFIIQGVSVNKKPSDKEKAIFAILKNIINRGTPTIPSNYLLKKLNYENKYNAFKYTKDTNLLNWQSDIKGGLNNNPAAQFYKEILPSLLNNNLVLLNSFLPECSTLDIVKNTSSNYVDFYSPLLKLIIEIDGVQHNEEVQNKKDRLRDKLFKQHSIQTIRVKTKDLESKNIEIDVSNITKVNEMFIDQSTISYEEMSYQYIIRYQMLLIELLSNGTLSLSSPNWFFELKQHEKTNIDCLSVAFYDLMLWIENIASLIGFKFTRPKIEAVELSMFTDVDNIKIDASIFKKFETFKESSIYFIRNDYFLYDANANSVQNYPQFKNYYQNSIAKAEYTLSFANDSHKKALTFFLHNIFKYKEFRNKQLEIIIETLNNEKNVIGLLSTGAGKSLIYQIVSMLLPSQTLVISPLKALMEDQYEEMKNFGINNTTFINSDNADGLIKITNNQSKITLLSPERFFNQNFILNIIKNNIGFLVIDEVHCLSEWGHDFRTSYLCLIPAFKKYFSNNCRLLGLTATASPRVLADIEIEFNNFKNNTNIMAAESLERDELNINIVSCIDDMDRYNKLLNLLDLNKKTIVFTKIKKSKEKYLSACHSLSENIKVHYNIDKNSTLIDYYSSENKKEENETLNSEKIKNIKQNRTKLLFATKSFGMGINIPDIRQVIHFGLPSSIESLYQEMGRAGRDGTPSNCNVLYIKENEKNINELFKPNITIKELSNIGKESKLKEFDTNLYFITNYTLDIEEELLLIQLIYKFLLELNNNGNTAFNLEQLKKYIEATEKLDVKTIKKLTNIVVEKVLYRLLILGLINLWNINYTIRLDNPIYENIIINNISEEECVKNLNRYINKYDPKYSYSIAAKLSLIIKELLSWIFKNFVYQRVQSIKNIYELCENHKDPIQTMRNIVEFLSNEISYHALIKNPDDYMEWFYILKKDKPSTIKNKINRYLESYDNLVSINFIAGINKIFLKEFEDLDGRYRLTKAIKEIATYEEKTVKKIIIKTLNFLNEQVLKNHFIELFLSELPQYSSFIYEIEKDNTSASYYVNYIAQRLIKTGENVYDKCRKNQ